jgi:hypothetical protein
VPDCYRWYDLPAGRSWESFRYLIEEREAPWAGEHFIDALVTDEESERDRIVAHIVSDFHEAGVTDRVIGEIVHADGSGAP